MEQLKLDAGSLFRGFRALGFGSIFRFSGFSDYLVVEWIHFTLLGKYFPL